MKHMKYLPFALFLGASTLILIFVGMGLGHFGLPPYPQARDAAKTAAALWETILPPAYFGETSGRSEQPRANISRWLLADAKDPQTYWIAGGLNQFLKECPQLGCLAVQIDKTGTVLAAVPYRPADILDASLPEAESAYEHFGIDPLRNTRPIGIEIYADGDLLVTFQANGAVFPYGTGVARIAADGTPRWFRFAYAHHWPTMLDDQTALVPALRIADVQAEVWTATGLPNLTCDANSQMLDVIRHLGPDGALIEEIDVMAAMLASPFAQYIMNTSDPCDWLHLNYIDVLDGSAGADTAAGDLLLSFRNINAVAVMDRVDHSIKKLVRGNFLQQHAAQQLDGSEIVLFNNWGGTSVTGASEVLTLDLETGLERVLFPNPSTPTVYRELQSGRAGYISRSPDGSRLLAVYSEAGLAFEIERTTGDLISVYEHAHDVSSVSGIPDFAQALAVRYDLFSMLY